MQKNLTFIAAALLGGCTTSGGLNQNAIAR